MSDVKEGVYNLENIDKGKSEMLDLAAMFTSWVFIDNPEERKLKAIEDVKSISEDPDKGPEFAKLALNAYAERLESRLRAAGVKTPKAYEGVEFYRSLIPANETSNG